MRGTPTCFSTIDVRFTARLSFSCFACSGASTDAAGHLQAGTCCKHFAVYNIEGNAGAPSRVYFDAEVNARDMWGHYMPAFEARAKTAASL